MALRVLLADESSTIKKVVQLTLQDFDVDVRSVSVGLDVVSVAKTFHPDVVMADVLLAKRSGYEVCHDLKNDPETAEIPVILMWSGFMEIDEQKARLCGADRRIEKPFDPSSLRNIVKELVQKTLTNPVSPYVQFPPLPEFQEAPVKPTAASPVAPQISTEQPAPRPPAPQPAAPTATQAPQNRPAMPTLPTAPEPTSFNFHSLEATGTGIAMPDDDAALIIDDSDAEPNDEWVQKPPPASRPVTKPTASPAAHYQTPRTAAPQMTKMTPQPSHEEEFAEFQLDSGPANNSSEALTAQVASQLQGFANEDIVREEIQKWLAANMGPIAERIIRDEINRLLQDSEQSIENP